MRKTLAVVGLLSVLAAAAATRDLTPRRASPPVAARAGCLAPDFRLSDTAGREWQLRALKGQPVLLAFVCGCSDCRRLLTKFGKHPLPAGRLLAISVLPPEQIRQLTTLTNGQFTGLFDSFAKTAAVYSSVRCPRVWVINRDQVIVYASDAERSGPAEVLARACEALRGGRRQHPTPGLYASAAARLHELVGHDGHGTATEQGVAP